MMFGETGSMARVEKVSVALTPEMAGLVRQAVEAGEYASAGDLMREALQDWQQRRAERQDALQEVGRLWDEGLASGPSNETFDPSGIVGIDGGIVAEDPLEAPRGVPPPPCLAVGVPRRVVVMSGLGCGEDDGQDHSR